MDIYIYTHQDGVWLNGGSYPRITGRRGKYGLLVTSGFVSRLHIPLTLVLHERGSHLNAPYGHYQTCLTHRDTGPLKL